ncbi:MAG TPA: UrcA family protein [Rhizomicrobium sp.]|jgi:UrcA family protein
MQNRLIAFRAIPFALGIGLCGLAATSAYAQDYGPNESLTVTVPRFHEERTPLNGTVQKVSLSQHVHYTVRDLTNPARSERLRWRVWQTAQDVCGKLAEAYPFYTMTTAHSCERDAYSDAMAKIDARIAGARIAYGYSY